MRERSHQSPEQFGKREVMVISFSNRFLWRFGGGNVWTRNHQPLHDAERMKKTSSGFQPTPTTSENAASKTPKVTSKSTKASAHKEAARRIGSKVRGR